MATHPKKAAPKHADKVVLNCSVESCNFSTKLSAFAKQELGRHMKFVHGVEGASSSAKLMQARKNGTISSIELKPPFDIQPEPTTPVQINGAAKRQYTRRSTVNVGYDTQALINVGKIIASCEAEAEKLGTSKESFTKRCAELFYASQVR